MLDYIYCKAFVSNIKQCKMNMNVVICQSVFVIEINITNRLWLRNIIIDNSFLSHTISRLNNYQLFFHWVI